MNVDCRTIRSTINIVYCIINIYFYIFLIYEVKFSEEPSIEKKPRNFLIKKYKINCKNFTLVCHTKISLLKESNDFTDSVKSLDGLVTKAYSFDYGTLCQEVLKVVASVSP